MNILLPLDTDAVQDASLMPLNDVATWGVVTIEEGQVVEIECYKRREDISVVIDVVVVCDSSEYIWPFVEEQIGVLVAPTQRSIDDIVEAFLFKELYEAS